MKDFIVGLKVFVVLSLITGVLYPGFISAYATLVASAKAQGSFISKEGTIRGSELIAQKFTQDKYFFSRPSAIDYDSRTSGASNQGPTSDTLKNQVAERVAILKAANPEATQSIPQDLLYASGSGLDPHISPEAAQYQAAKVAKARNMDLKTVMGLVNSMTEKPQFGILGEPRVNVLKLNLALDAVR